MKPIGHFRPFDMLPGHAHGKRPRVTSFPLHAAPEHDVSELTSQGSLVAALRTTLFTAETHASSKAVRRKLLVNEEPLKIRFTGWRLNQFDLDIWDALQRMARRNSSGCKVICTAHELLRLSDKKIDKTHREALKNAFAHLIGCCVEVTYGNVTYGGNFIGFRRSDRSERYEINVNPQMSRLCTEIRDADRQDRRQIDSEQGMALWFHEYLTGYGHVKSVDISVLRLLSGMDDDIHVFREKISAALMHLQKRHLVRCFAFEEGDRLRIERASPSCSEEYAC